MDMEFYLYILAAAVLVSFLKDPFVIFVERYKHEKRMISDPDYRRAYLHIQLLASDLKKAGLI